MASPLRTLTRSIHGHGPGRGRWSAWRSILVAGTLAIVHSAASGQAPSVNRAILTTTAPLTGEQSASLKEFVSRWVSDVARSSEPAEITAARDILTGPARDPSASPIFRRAYSTAVLAELKPIVEGKELRRAVNGLQVARFLRSPESVDLIVGRLSPTEESDAAKRLAAASTLAAAVLDADLSPVQFDGIIRTITANATAEKDDQVLVQEMKVLAGITRRSGLAANSFDAAMAGQVRLLGVLADSVSSSPKADARMASVARALVSLRNQWLELSQPQAKTLGPSLGPVVAKVLAAADQQWDSAQADPNLNATYGIGVATAETLMRLVDRTLRPSAYPAPKPGSKDEEARVLASSWSAGTKDAFEAEVQRWSGIVKAAPYPTK
jgi:hypothetical protein